MIGSKIQWTDHTFNPWVGCTKIGPGCDNCYAEAWSKRAGRDVWGNVDRQLTKTWADPVKWNKEAAQGLFVECTQCGLREFRKWDNSLPPGGLSCCSNPDCSALPESESQPVRPRVFCASLADVFDNQVPKEWRQRLWDLIDATPNLDWLLLTKRVGNVRQMIQDRWSITPPPNVWLGITVVNQLEADRDIPKLLEINSYVRFLSMEPLLGPVDLSAFLDLERRCPRCGWRGFGPLGSPCLRCCCPAGDACWVIAGGESGPKARPFTLGYAKDIVRQCKAAGVPVFVKQMGARPVNREGEPCPHIKDRKGSDMAEWPTELRVREFPA